MRCFVAVKVSEPVRNALRRAQDELRRSGADVRWVGEETLHLTLRFLGDLPEEAVERLKARLAADRRPPFPLEFAGAGAFPERGAPRVVWAGCRGDLDALRDLAAAVDRAAEEVGAPREEHPFAAHVTIGRVRSERNAARLREAIAGLAGTVFGAEAVTSIALVKSTLRPEGPLYETLETFPLVAT